MSSRRMHLVFFFLTSILLGCSPSVSSASAKVTALPSASAPDATVTPLPPLVFEGSGDFSIDVPPHESSLLRISGNASSSHFAVSTYSETGELIKNLVDTRIPYKGVRPLDFREGQQTTRLEVKAASRWRIELLPIGMARRVYSPGAFEGNGDDVVIIQSGAPERARITGNTAAVPFRVTAFMDDSGIDVLVDTTKPTDVNLPVRSNLVVIVVNAVGNWRIELSEAAGQSVS